jgi:DNA replication protein DnaC
MKIRLGFGSGKSHLMLALMLRALGIGQRKGGKPTSK